jgi:hypothetical protein
MGDDGIKGAEEVEFAGIIGGGIAERGNLDVHGRNSGRLPKRVKPNSKSVHEGIQNNPSAAVGAALLRA